MPATVMLPLKGAFVPPAELAHLVRFLGTKSGTDYTMMVIQYSSKIAVWALLRQNVKSQLAASLQKISAKISDGRTLFRFFGLVNTLQWILSLEDPNSKPASAASHLLQRLQAWSLALYYPLEHFYFLGMHAIIPVTAARITKAALWSTRFWAVYVILEFLHLAERARLVKAAEEQLDATSDEKLDPATRQAEVVAIRRTRQNIRTSLLINTAYFPLTLQWSLTKGLWTNDIWTGLFGTIAAVEGWRLGWRATA